MKNDRDNEYEFAFKIVLFIFSRKEPNGIKLSDYFILLSQTFCSQQSE
jgi:hypothetical protein